MRHPHEEHTRNGAREAEEFAAALGQVMGGGYRLILHAYRHGVPEALGLTRDEWVNTRLGGYVRLAVPDRQEAVKELEEEGLSQRQVAEVLGVDEGTVRNDKRVEKSA